MAVADRHQPLADIGAGRDRHAQPVGRVLVDEAPVGAHQEAPLGLAHAVEVAARRRRACGSRRCPSVGISRVERQLSSVVLPEPDSPTTASTSPGQSSKRDVAAADAAAVEFGHAAYAQKRWIAHSAASMLRHSGRHGPPRAAPRNGRCRSRRTSARPVVEDHLVEIDARRRRTARRARRSVWTSKGWSSKSRLTTSV